MQWEDLEPARQKEANGIGKHVQGEGVQEIQRGSRVLGGWGWGEMHGRK